MRRRTVTPTFAPAYRALVISLSLVCAAVGCAEQPSADSDRIRSVKTVVVGLREMSDVRAFTGQVEASKRADLAFQVPGLLVKFRRKEGDRVRRGEVIAELRQDEFQARVSTAQGQLDQARAGLRALQSGERSEEQLRREAQLRVAEARLANAKTELDRYSELVKSRAVSRSEYELAETAYHVAQEEQKAAIQIVEKGTVGRKEDIDAQKAVVRGLEGRAAEATLQMKDSTLRAPYDGIIAQRLVDEGQTITANSTVVKFQDGEGIDIVVDVPETFMPIQAHPASIVRMFAELSVAPGRKFPVTFKEAAQVADPNTQTYQVRFTMKAPEGIKPLPGMTATVTVASKRAGTAESRLLVPISAITRLDTGAQVAWVIGPDDTVNSRPVSIGAARGERIEVVKGLRPGDRIVVAGVTFLREGMRVRDLGDALGAGRP